MLGVGAAGPRGPDTPLPARSAGLAGVPEEHRPGERVALPRHAGRDSGLPWTPERLAWAALDRVSGLGPFTFGLLLERHGSARAVLDAAWSESAGPDPAVHPDGSELLTSELRGRIRAAALASDRIAADLETAGVWFVTLDDDAYPASLRQIELPPPVLYGVGSVPALSASPGVAVVGTRRPTERGRRLAARIAGALSEAGAGIVSGLAFGIDAAAHVGALEAGGTTVAVLGGGHAHLSPRSHATLAAQIADHGGSVVSELPPPSIPSRGTFPRRNRIISGLAAATVVVEAGHRSGALITAGWALEQGRDCYLVPGHLDAVTSAGCLAFLRSYHGEARIVAGVRELLEDLGLTGDRGAGSSHIRASSPPGSSQSAAAGSAAQAVTRALGDDPRTVDELVSVSGLPAAAVLSALTVLELEGTIQSAYGRYRLRETTRAAGP